MTDKLRARARELAGAVYWNAGDADASGKIDAIEASILQFAREALREEPDEAMIKRGYKQDEPRDVWNVMAEARARGLE